MKVKRRQVEFLLATTILLFLTIYKEYANILPWMVQSSSNDHLYSLQSNLPHVADYYRNCGDNWKGITDGYTIVGYAKTSISKCTAPLCRLNDNRERVKRVESSLPCLKVEDCVTMTIKTRGRLGKVADLINSVRKFYPKMKFVVADVLGEAIKPSLAWDRIYNKIDGLVSYFQTSKGMGLGRKMAIQLAETKYALVSDDDFLFTKKTSIEKLLAILEMTDISIVGGLVGDKHQFDGVLRVSPTLNNSSLAYLVHYDRTFYEPVSCFSHCFVGDIVRNFYLIKPKNVLEAGSWDIFRETFEHTDFFMQMRMRGLKVALCVDVNVPHAKDTSLHKLRKPLFKKLRADLYRKWNIEDYYFCPGLSYINEPVCQKPRSY